MSNSKNNISQCLRKLCGLSSSTPKAEFDTQQRPIVQQFVGNRHRECPVNHEEPARYAIIYRSEFDYMSRCILDYPNIETGGQLFGFWTNAGVPVVLFAVGPGPRARHNATSFFQDMHFIEGLAVKIISCYALQHIGEWHSHHQLSLACPSRGDVYAMTSGLNNADFRRMLLCIGNCTPRQTEINAFNFHVNTMDKYVDADWRVIEMESPFRSLIEKEFEGLIPIPRTRQASHGPKNAPHGTVRRPQAPMVVPEKVHWMSQSPENLAIIKQYLEEVKGMFPDEEVKTYVSDLGEPFFETSSGIVIKFTFDFPTAPPVITIGGSPLDNLQCWDPRNTDLPGKLKEWAIVNLKQFISKNPTHSYDNHEQK